MKMRKTRKRRKLTRTQTTIIIIILLCFALVIAFLIFSLFNRPETRAKNIISSLANEYYETYLYPSFSNSDSFKQNPSEIMAKYENNGFSTIALRQLLLYDDQKNEHYYDYLSKYCNPDHTYIKFYPDSPYGKADYHVQYTYSCEF